MDGKRFLHSIKIRNLLSFGESQQVIDLQPLNVLIGPNGSGKSNLIEVISLLRDVPRESNFPERLTDAFSGVEWFWKGSRKPKLAEMVTVTRAHNEGRCVRHGITLTEDPSVRIVDEFIELAGHDLGGTQRYYDFRDGSPVLSVLTGANGMLESRSEQPIEPENIDARRSVLAQFRDPSRYPELTYLGNTFPQIAIYRGWDLNRNSPIRLPQRFDRARRHLEEDASNLALVLNQLLPRDDTGDRLLDLLRGAYAPIRKLLMKDTLGAIQLYVQEDGLSEPMPATNISDGTLHYLCLLVVLIHPSPPPLVCIEEPEIGLHPDLMPTLADLLIDASQRTQLVVTTHSVDLVSALSRTPEVVMVCEKPGNETRFRRLDRDDLKEWLEKYSLGELWQMGEIGGTRW